MSESFKHKVERLEHQPTLPSLETHKQIAEKAEQARKAEKAHAESLVSAREKVAEVAKKEHKQIKHETLASHAHHATSVNSELKSVTLNREMKNIRRRLNPAERSLSKVIHRPAIRAISEATGKTLARPSGLLGGGLLALIGTTGYLWLARHIGFEYNYAVFLVLFIAGFLIGLFIEIIIYSLHSRRHHRHHS